MKVKIHCLGFQSAIIIIITLSFLNECICLCVSGICFKTENLSKQESVNVKQFEGLEEANHFTAEHPEVMDDVPSPAATLPANDSSEENSKYVKDRVKCLWKEINEIFERRQFSSAVILRRHLETVEVGYFPDFKTILRIFQILGR